MLNPELILGYRLYKCWIEREKRNYYLVKLNAWFNLIMSRNLTEEFLEHKRIALFLQFFVQQI